MPGNVGLVHYFRFVELLCGGRDGGRDGSAVAGGGGFMGGAETTVAATTATAVSVTAVWCVDEAAHIAAAGGQSGQRGVNTSDDGGGGASAVDAGLASFKQLLLSGFTVVKHSRKGTTMKMTERRMQVRNDDVDVLLLTGWLTCPCSLFSFLRSLLSLLRR